MGYSAPTEGAVRLQVLSENRDRGRRHVIGDQHTVLCPRSTRCTGTQSHPCNSAHVVPETDPQGTTSAEMRRGGLEVRVDGEPALGAAAVEVRQHVELEQGEVPVRRVAVLVLERVQPLFE